MADSGALRQRRYKQHRAGNHALCRGDCAKSPQDSATLTVLREVPPASESFDPQTAMLDLAAQLRDACAANPADAVLAREYRLTLQALTPPKETDDDLTGLLASLQR